MLKRKINVFALLLIYLIIVIAGCAGMNQQNPDEMSPKEIAIWANRNYEAQYEAYLQDYEFGRDHTVMREALIRKCELLVNIYPVLLLYNEVLLDEQLPGPALTNELVRLIYELTGVY